MITQSSMPLTRILSQISRARILPAVCASSLPHISTITNRQSAHMPDGVVIAACFTTQDIHHARMPCRLNTQSSPGLCVFRLFSCSRAFTVMEPALNAIDLNPGPQFDWLTNIAIICFHTMPNPVTSNCCKVRWVDRRQIRRQMTSEGADYNGLQLSWQPSRQVADELTYCTWANTLQLNLQSAAELKMLSCVTLTRNNLAELTYCTWVNTMQLS